MEVLFRLSHNQIPWEEQSDRTLSTCPLPVSSLALLGSPELSRHLVTGNGRFPSPSAAPTL